MLPKIGFTNFSGKLNSITANQIKEYLNDHNYRNNRNSIVFFSIGAWVFWTISKQDKTLYDWDDFSEWKNDEDEEFHDEVG